MILYRVSSKLHTYNKDTVLGEEDVGSNLKNNNYQHLHSIHYKPGIKVSTQGTLRHVIPTPALGGWGTGFLTWRRKCRFSGHKYLFQGVCLPELSSLSVVTLYCVLLFPSLLTLSVPSSELLASVMPTVLQT